ncbi:MAG: SDR family NAD(P)-dependent oxidoreductase [Bacteroidota bacterium]
MKDSHTYYLDKRDLLADLLQILADDPSLANEDERIKGLITKIHKKAKKQKRAIASAKARQADMAKRANSLLFQQNDERQAGSPDMIHADDEQHPHLERPQRCYICKSSYQELHAFYHYLCPDCAKTNFARRSDHCELTGRTALLTGGRIKIGYEIALRLLRCGATVHITTRFPTNAFETYAQENDYQEWKDRLKIHGLDFRNLPALQHLIDQLSTELNSLEILINNAAQTISRPEAFYAPLLAKEQKRYLLQGDIKTQSDMTSLLFPSGKQDIYGQQLDLRADNSWVQTLDQVSLKEMLEVQLVNVTAPFLLCSQLRPLMKRSPFDRTFVVNVSAMEGVFNRPYKSPWHPHTNMGKAALNMMTRTSAQDYVRDGIYMTSVDTGWVTDENPAPKRERLRASGFVPPLDVVDGAARVLAPIFDGLKQSSPPLHGVFLKDYHISNW